MSTFTTVTKQKLSWPSPATVSSSSEYFLLLDDTYFLLISDTYKLIINSGAGRLDTNWTPLIKSR